MDLQFNHFENHMRPVLGHKYGQSPKLSACQFRPSEERT